MRSLEQENKIEYYLYTTIYIITTNSFITHMKSMNSERTLKHELYLPNSSYATKISTFGKNFKDLKKEEKGSHSKHVKNHSYLFLIGPVNPRASEVINLSMGKPVPASAQAPRGQKLSLARQSSKRCASRSSYNT